MIELHVELNLQLCHCNNNLARDVLALNNDVQKGSRLILHVRWMMKMIYLAYKYSDSRRIERTGRMFVRPTLFVCLFYLTAINRMLSSKMFGVKISLPISCVTIINFNRELSKWKPGKPSIWGTCATKDWLAASSILHEGVSLRRTKKECAT